MRVLYFTGANSPHDRRFLSALAETEHRVFALRFADCTPETPAGITELDWPEGRPDWSDWDGWQAAKKQFLKILDHIQPDLVHAGPIQQSAMLTFLSGFHPLISMSWGSDLLKLAKRSPWMRHATRCALSGSDLFLADCRTVADEALHYGFPPDRIVQFPWGVDLAHFSPKTARPPGIKLRESLGWEDQFVILCNRSWAPIYGVNLLAQAFVSAVHVNQNLRLLLVGDGSQAAHIRRILEPVMHAVHLPGQMDLVDLPVVYGAADLYVTPSHCDGSSVSLMEAMACGCAVLASDIPSNREWVTPGQTGDLFKDGNLNSLVEKLLALPEDPNIASYGKAARLVAEERADWQRNFQKLLMAYEMAVG